MKASPALADGSPKRQTGTWTPLPGPESLSPWHRAGDGSACAWRMPRSRRCGDGSPAPSASSTARKPARSRTARLTATPSLTSRHGGSSPRSALPDTASRSRQSWPAHGSASAGVSHPKIPRRFSSGSNGKRHRTVGRFPLGDRLPRPPHSLRSISLVRCR